MIIGEAIDGVQPIVKIRQELECGRWPINMHFLIDAKSVFDCVSSTDAKLLVEQGFTGHVFILRDLIRYDILELVCWIQINFISAEGLTKGVVAREALLKFCNSRRWLGGGRFKCTNVKRDVLQQSKGTENVDLPEQLKRLEIS